MARLSFTALIVLVLSIFSLGVVAPKPQNDAPASIETFLLSQLGCHKRKSERAQDKKPSKLGEYAPYMDAFTDEVAGWLRQTGKNLNNEIGKQRTARSEESGDVAGTVLLLLGNATEYIVFECAADWIEQKNEDLQNNPLGTLMKDGTKFMFMVTPGGAWMPLLRMGGFGPKGPIAGTLVSFIQSKIGNVGARSAFAILQSAMQGGYGKPILNALVRQSYLGYQVAHKAVNWWFSKDDNEKVNDNGHKTDYAADLQIVNADSYETKILEALKRSGFESFQGSEKSAKWWLPGQENLDMMRSTMQFMRGMTLPNQNVADWGAMIRKAALDVTLCSEYGECFPQVTETSPDIKAQA